MASTTKSLSGKVAIVTGGSRGIGRAVAFGLAQQGATVVIFYTNNDTKAQESLKKVESVGAIGHLVKGNVANLQDIKRLFEETLAKFKKIDIVVHAAAISEFKLVVDVTEEDYDRVFNVNTKGSFFVLQHAAKSISPNGRIVAFSTGGTRSSTALGYSSVYFASKAAVEQFVKSLAAELGPKNVTVNTVSPGTTDTDMMHPMFKESGANASPFKRLGTAEEVAEIVLFLVSEKGGWFTGQTLQSGGGVVLA